MPETSASQDEGPAGGLAAVGHFVDIAQVTSVRLKVVESQLVTVITIRTAVIRRIFLKVLEKW